MPSKVSVNRNFVPQKKFVANDPCSATLPKNWPDDITFLREPTYSTSVTPEMRTGLCRITSRNDSFPRIERETVEAPSKVEIRLIDDLHHPVRGHRGLFAVTNLIPDALICLYLGHTHTNARADTDTQSDYDLNLDFDLGLSIDARHAGNHARFANDYRGIAASPNAEFRDCFVQVPCVGRMSGCKWERRVGVFVMSAGNTIKRKNGIEAGEEVLINYGKHYWEARRTEGKFGRDEHASRVAEAALSA